MNVWYFITMGAMIGALAISISIAHKHKKELARSERERSRETHEYIYRQQTRKMLRELKESENFNEVEWLEDKVIELLAERDARL